MTNACLHHCRHLSLRSTSEQLGVCLASPLNCRKYREGFAPDAERTALTKTLESVFDLKAIPNEIDIVTLAEAILDGDTDDAKQMLQESLPQLTWIQLDDVGIGNDWGGMKLSLVCAINHPHLKAAVGLVITVNAAKLTLGRIEYANTQSFCQSIADQSIDYSSNPQNTVKKVIQLTAIN